MARWQGARWTLDDLARWKAHFEQLDALGHWQGAPQIKSSTPIDKQGAPQTMAAHTNRMLQGSLEKDLAREGKKVVESNLVRKHALDLGAYTYTDQRS